MYKCISYTYCFLQNMQLLLIILIKQIIHIRYCSIKITHAIITFPLWLLRYILKGHNIRNSLTSTGKQFNYLICIQECCDLIRVVLTCNLHIQVRVPVGLLNLSIILIIPLKKVSVCQYFKSYSFLSCISVIIDELKLLQRILYSYTLLKRNQFYSKARLSFF